MTWRRPLGALVQFQFRSGVRVAVRAMVPLAAAFTAGSVWMGNPLFLLAPIAATLFPAQASLMSALLAAAVTAAAAKALAPRTGRGMAGWINHLPVSGDQRRRASVIGLVVALTPWLVLVIFAGYSVFHLRPAATALRLCAIPMLAAGSAMTALPIRGPARLFGFLGAVFSWVGAWWMLPPAVLALWTADRMAGRLGVIRPRRRWTGNQAKRFLPAAFGTYARITARAMGWRVVTAALLSAVVAAPALLFVHNNQLTVGQEHLAIRLACLMAVVLSMAMTAESLSVRRPPWPWLRSLPMSSSRKVFMDVVLLVLVTAPALAIAGSRFWVALPVIGVVPFLALRAASGVRRAPGRQSGASGQVLAEGAVAAMAVALLPWAALAWVLAVPFALRWAVDDERRQDVSGWHELQHLAAGDPAAWSDA